jgi:hypothetical protein
LRSEVTTASTERLACNGEDPAHDLKCHDIDGGDDSPRQKHPDQVQ